MGNNTMGDLIANCDLCQADGAPRQAGYIGRYVG